MVISTPLKKTCSSHERFFSSQKTLNLKKFATHLSSFAWRHALMVLRKSKLWQPRVPVILEALGGLFWVKPTHRARICFEPRSCSCLRLLKEFGKKDNWLPSSWRFLGSKKWHQNNTFKANKKDWLESGLASQWIHGFRKSHTTKP